MKIVTDVRILPEKSGNLPVARWVNVSPQSKLPADKLWVLPSRAEITGVLKFASPLPICIQSVETAYIKLSNKSL